LYKRAFVRGPHSADPENAVEYGAMYKKDVVVRGALAAESR
jgi:hypothetical protein